MQTPSHLDGNAAFEFLDSRIDFERSLSIPYSKRDFRLDRMRELLARLGNPQERLRIVHIAGTKGKGSTAAMLASILTSAGYRTGLYSSPHLESVQERLMVDGQPCTVSELAALVATIRLVVDAMDAMSGDDELGSTRPTYFEIVTAMALLHFANCEVELAVLEVGMGGRLDSTNVCQPLVSIITNISFDHTQQLGTTLAAIAGEKAGIIKPGVPVVSGVIEQEPREVIAAVAQANGCRLIEAGRDFQFTYQPPRDLENAVPVAEIDYRFVGEPGSDLRHIKLSLLGRHQAANAAVALTAMRELQSLGFNVSEDALRRALSEVFWPARIETVRRNPTVVLDAAHNVASAKSLARTLEESFTSSRRLLVFATTRDKDWRGMLDVLLPFFDEVVFTRYWSNPRGVPPEELAAGAADVTSIEQHLAVDAATSWRLVQSRATTEDLICIAGSFFIIAETRAAMSTALDAPWQGAQKTPG